jgi:inosine-uridine nucleoside N-ribohydrolase
MGNWNSRLLMLLLFLPSMVIAQEFRKHKPVIFDSDMGPDYDDVGALAMLHAYADSGYFKILATIASTNYEGVAGVFNVINSYFNRPGIPIGVPHKKGVNIRDFQHWSDTLLAKYPHQVKNNADVEEAVDVYRRVLSGQPDKSVTIITVGFLTNLAALLQSGSDQYSRLNGKQLVKKKVKQLVSMAGGFPSFKEFNIKIDSVASGYVFSHWPTPVLLSGFEIGVKIKSGLPLIQNHGIQNSPIKDVFRISIPMAKSDSAGRMSWDETAVLVAAKGYSPHYTIQKGTMIIHQDGSNSWSSQGRKHAYLVEKLPSAEVEEIINKVIQHQPSAFGRSEF